MPYRRGARGFAAGALGGLADVSTYMLKQDDADKQNARITGRELLKDYSDRVTKGEIDPDQAEAALTKQGINIPRGYFADLQPSVSRQLQGLVGDMTKAGNVAQVPGDEALKVLAPKRMPLVGFGQTGQDSGGQFDPETGNETLASRSYGPTPSREWQQLQKIRDEKLGGFPPERVESYNPDLATTETQFVPSNPRELTGRSFQRGPSPEQLGENQATTALAQKRGEVQGGLPTLTGQATGQTNIAQTSTENAGGLPTMKGQGRQQELLAGDLSAPVTAAKARQSAAVTSADANARLDVEGSPKAMALREAQKRLDNQLATEFASAGLDPSFAQSFVHHSPYGTFAFVDPSVPAEERKYIYKTLAGAAKTSGTPIAYLNKEETNIMELLDRAATNYDTIVQQFVGALPKDAAGRIIAGPANLLSQYLQTNPQLSAAVADFASIMEIAAAQMAGVRGARIGQEFLKSIKSAGPQPTDTLQVLRQKQMLTEKFLANTASAILRR